MAILNDGTLWGWGKMRLGNNNKPEIYLTPQKVADRVEKIFCGAGVSYYLTEEGKN